MRTGNQVQELIPAAKGVVERGRGEIWVTSLIDNRVILTISVLKWSQHGSTQRIVISFIAIHYYIFIKLTIIITRSHKLGIPDPLHRKISQRKYLQRDLKLFLSQAALLL